MSVNPTVPKRWRVGFDIGGTFTDFVMFDREDRPRAPHKRLTSPTTLRAR
jgi:5-oxoprolinase (ATP-hydrolysing)